MDDERIKKISENKLILSDAFYNIVDSLKHIKDY